MRRQTSILDRRRPAMVDIPQGSGLFTTERSSFVLVLPICSFPPGTVHSMRFSVPFSVSLPLGHRSLVKPEL
jgi:hypothetical protein